MPRATRARRPRACMTGRAPGSASTPPTSCGSDGAPRPHEGAARRGPLRRGGGAEGPAPRSGGVWYPMGVDDGERYRVALLDWLACAAGGWDEPPARAARAASDPITALGTAGHVLDFDDTWLPGIAHLSAPTAPAALVLAAELEQSVGAALESYAAGFEAMAALAGAGYPALYDGGWHPTAVCGTVGAAVAAATLLGIDRDAAAALAALRAAGLRAAFGGDGKSLQVGLAASAGAGAARLVAEGASVDLARARSGWEQAYGAPWGTGLGEAAIRTNWIKAY